MDYNLVDLVAKILQVITYMSLGGLVSMSFFFIFAPSLLGINRIQASLRILEQQNRDTNRLLASIDNQLKSLMKRDEPPADQGKIS
jgi:hypothetical protein